MEPSTSSKPIVTVNMDEIFGTVTKAWDTMFIPTPPEDFANDELTFDYSNKMQELVKDLVLRANEMEAKAQKLAEANVRQMKIIGDLRAEIWNAKLKEIPGRLPDHES